MKEKTVENALKRETVMRKGVCIKLLPFAFIGLPDRLLLIPWGRFYLVETKSIFGVVSKIQEKVHGKFESIGCPVHILWSVEQVHDFFKLVDDGIL